MYDFTDKKGKHHYSRDNRSCPGQAMKMMSPNGFRRTRNEQMSTNYEHFDMQFERSKSRLRHFNSRKYLGAKGNLPNHLTYSPNSKKSKHSFNIPIDQHYRQMIWRQSGKRDVPSKSNKAPANFAIGFGSLMRKYRHAMNHDNLSGNLKGGRISRTGKK